MANPNFMQMQRGQDFTLKQLQEMSERDLFLNAVKGCGLGFLRCLCDPRIQYILRRFPTTIWEVVALACETCERPVIPAEPPPADKVPPIGLKLPPIDIKPPDNKQPPPTQLCPLPSKGTYGGGT